MYFPLFFLQLLLLLFANSGKNLFPLKKKRGSAAPYSMKLFSNMIDIRFIPRL